MVWNREVRVVESGAEPACRRMAGIAGGRIARRNMVRYGATKGLRAVPVRYVAAIASRIR